MPYKDPERRREYGRDWMRRNPEKAREGMRRWRARNRASDRGNKQRYYAENKARVKAAVIAYRRANPDVVRTLKHLRRGREMRALGAHTTAEWRELVRRYDGRCAYCSGQGPLTRDHRIPLARGGSNAIENLVPACRSCNARKRLMTEEEFRARLARKEA
jgi:5-methylcytosine-specific restriction endonuclease McrA